MAELDHGSLATVWDEYAAKFGALDLHLHKIEPDVLGKLNDAVAGAVKAGAPLTVADIEATGYRHPVDGLYF